MTFCYCDFCTFPTAIVVMVEHFSTETVVLAGLFTLPLSYRCAEAFACKCALTASDEKQKKKRGNTHNSLFVLFEMAAGS